MADLIDAMLNDDGGEGTLPPKRDLGSLLGKAVAGSSSRPTPAVAAAPDLDVLGSLRASDWKVVARYVAADDVVPILGGAPMVVAVRLVEAFDAEGQAWIGAQASAIEAVTQAEHAAAARTLLALVERLRNEGRFSTDTGSGSSTTATAAIPARVDERVAPNRGGLGVSVAVKQDAPAPAASAPRAAAPAQPSGDALSETIASLVAGARKQNPATLNALADAVDHPVIAAGLRLIAGGADAHALGEGLRSLEHDYLSEQERQLAVIRAGLLSIRFGETADDFRKRL